MSNHRALRTTLACLLLALATLGAGWWLAEYTEAREVLTWLEQDEVEGCHIEWDSVRANVYCKGDKGE